MRREVPPWVVVNDDVGGGQVQPCAPGFQRDEENGSFPRVEIPHQLRPFFLRGGAFQREACQLFFVQTLAEEPEHCGELGKQKNLVPVFRHAGAKLEAGFQLAAFAPVVLKAEARVAADLAQAGQLGQNLQLPLRLGRERLASLRGFREVNLALFFRKRNSADVLRFRRQLFEHVFFEPAEQKRLYQQAEPPLCRRVAALYNGLFQLCEERSVGKQVSRHQKIEEVPEFAEAVFNRRARHDKPLAAVDLFHSLGDGGRLVLDGLPLVQHAAVKFPLFVQGDVALQEVVRSDPDVGTVIPRNLRLPFGGAPKDEVYPEERRKFFEFVAPVEHQGGRADDKARGTRLHTGSGGKKGNHLHRFAKAHFVGQNSAEAVAFQRFQPLEPYPLVGTQPVVQLGRRGIVAFRHSLKIPDHGAVTVVAPDSQPFLFLQNLVQVQPAERRHGDAAALQVFGFQLGHVGDFGYFFAGGAVQHQVAAVAQLVVTLFPQKALVQRLQLFRRKFTGVEVEREQPAGDGNAHGRTAAADPFAFKLFRNVHFAEAAQLFQVVGKKIDRGVFVRQPVTPFAVERLKAAFQRLCRFRFGPGVPLDVFRCGKWRSVRNFLFSVLKNECRRNSPDGGKVEIIAGQAVVRQICLQQAVRVFHGDERLDFRQHAAAKSGKIVVGKVERAVSRSQKRFDVFGKFPAAFQNAAVVLGVPAFAVPKKREVPFGAHRYGGAGTA